MNVGKNNKDQLVFGASSSTVSDTSVMHDVSAMAEEAGILSPVIVTKTLWDSIEWSEKDNARQTYQDTTGRLWDVIWMLSLRLKMQRSSSQLLENPIYFKVSRIPKGGRAKTPKLTLLQATYLMDENNNEWLVISYPEEKIVSEELMESKTF